MILRVYRSSREAPRGRLQDFPVDTGPGTTVLDALVRLRETAAPDLAFRYACRVGMCGSCAMVVDGRERWACRTRLAALAGPEATVTVRPLYHFPVIRDLVVDMAPFTGRMRAVRAWHSPAEGPGPGHVAVRGGGRAAVDAAIECIGCGACVSACTMVRWNARFPGPAALNRAFTLAADGRDAGIPARWAALLGEDGLWRCHGQGQCTAVCPMGLAPSDSIFRLRRRAARALFARV